MSEPVDAAALTGAWELVAFREIDADGRRGEGPLGPDPAGRLLYTAAGQVAVHMMRRGPAATTAHMGYAGRWRLDGGRVVHLIEVSARPDWVGTEQIRDASLRGDTLTLLASTAIDGVPRHRELVWRRLTGAGSSSTD